MDPTSHIPSVRLFHYLNGSMPLTDDGHIDGALVGGASLNPASFVAIIKYL